MLFSFFFCTEANCVCEWQHSWLLQTPLQWEFGASLFQRQTHQGLLVAACLPESLLLPALHCSSVPIQLWTGTCLPHTSAGMKQGRCASWEALWEVRFGSYTLWHMQTRLILHQRACLLTVFRKSATSQQSPDSQDVVPEELRITESWTGVSL